MSKEKVSGGECIILLNSSEPAIEQIITKKLTTKVKTRTNTTEISRTVGK